MSENNDLIKKINEYLCKYDTRDLEYVYEQILIFEDFRKGDAEHKKQTQIQEQQKTMKMEGIKKILELSNVSKLRNLGLSTMVCNALARSKIYDILDLIEFIYDDTYNLGRIRGLGKKGQEEIINILKVLGVYELVVS